jgi:peptide chain release factor subunit 1
VNVPDLRALADMWELEPAFLSIFMDMRKGMDEGFLRRRQKECLGALAGHREQSELFRQALEQAERLLGGRTWMSEGVAVFSSPKRKYLEAFELPGEVENRLVFDSSPYIKPLVQLQHGWEESILVVLDHTQARIFVVSHHEILQKDTVAEEIVRKHRNGGMSQLRFQRLHDGYVSHYFKEVAEHLVAEVEKCHCFGRLRGIVLAGPKDAKVEFEKYLPAELNKLVLGMVTEPSDVPDCTAVRAADEMVNSKEAQREMELLGKLRDGILGRGLATYGFEEVRRATLEGRVDTLLVQKGSGLRGWRCERCRGFGAGAIPLCPTCGRPPLEVDAVEELVELAMDRGTRVEFVADDGSIAQLGGLGALLRY